MISVIITAYNAERYLSQSVRSILGQTYADIECIIVDDGSEDRTFGIAKSFKDRRVIAVEAGRVGRGAALNIGWRRANGEYIAIQDADDVSHPFRLDVEEGVLSANPEIAAVGSGHVMFVGDDPPKWDIDGIPYLSKPDFSLRNPMSHTSIMVRKEALECIGGYDESRTCLFDWDLYLRLMSGGHEIRMISKPLVAHRIHNRQFFESRKRMRYSMECAAMQWRSISQTGMNPFMAAVIPPLFLYRMFRRSA